jgi:hypothetical protein
MNVQVHNIINVPIPPLWKNDGSMFVTSAADNQSIASSMSGSSSPLSTASAAAEIKIPVHVGKTVNLVIS